MTIHYQAICAQFADTRSEYAIMGKIHAQCFAKAWSEATFREMFEDGAQYSGGMILQHGETLGFIICSKVLDQAEIMTICILPNHQGQGLGSRLLTRQLEDLRDQGVKDLFLEVNEFNKNAIQLYNRLGFTTNSLRKNYYKSADGKTADALVFSLNL